MSLTLVEVCEKLKDVDEVTLLEVLEITSDELIDRFQDRVEEGFDRFTRDFEDFDEEKWKDENL